MLPDWLELVITDDKATQIGLASLTGIALILFCLVHIPLGFRLLRAVLAGRKLRSAASLDSGAESSDADAKRREAVSRALDGTIFEPNLKSFLRGWNDSKNDYHQSPMRFASTFLENPLIPPGARRTLLGSIPGIFLAFGILGTFFGLTLALSQVQELAQDDTDGRINLLTASLSLAFRTSLLGIVFSVIFVLFARLIEGRAEYHEHSIDGFVHKFYPWLSPDEVSALSLKEQIRSTGTIATALESVSADLQNVLADGLQEIRDSASSTSSVVSEELVNTLSKTLNEGVAAHVSELSSAIAATTESQQSLGLLLQSANEAFQASNDAQQAIHSMLQDTAASVEKASTEITLAGNLFGPATSELSSASSSIKSTSEILSEAQTTAVTTMESLSDTLLSAHRNMESQQELVEAAISEINEAMKGFGEGLSNDLASALGQIDQALGESISRLNGTVHDSNETIDRFAPALAEMLEGLGRIAEGAQSLEPAISGLGKLVGETLAPVPGSIAALGRTNTDLDESLKGIVLRIESLDASLDERTRALADVLLKVGQGKDALISREEEKKKSWFR